LIWKTAQITKQIIPTIIKATAKNTFLPPNGPEVDKIILLFPSKSATL